MAEPRPVGDSVKAAVRRAAMRLGWSFSRAKDVWYGQARRIDVAEMDQLRNLAGQSRGEAPLVDEIAELRTRLERLERFLDAADAFERSPRAGVARAVVR